MASTLHQFQCPTCGQVTSAERLGELPYRPFCSRRCKLIDLGRWLDGTYRVSDPALPGADDDASDETAN